MSPQTEEQRARVLESLSKLPPVQDAHGHLLPRPRLMHCGHTWEEAAEDGAGISYCTNCTNPPQPSKIAELHARTRIRRTLLRAGL